MINKLKKIFSALLALAMIFGMSSLVSPAAAPASDGSMTLVFTIDKNAYLVNGITTIMDVSPTIVEARTLLPVRFVAEPLGAAVGWEEATSKVTIQLMDAKLELWIGQSNARVNGVTTAIDLGNPNVKPITLNDRTMLPIRFVTENLGCEVKWIEATQQVIITKEAVKPSEPGGGDGDETDADKSPSPSPTNTATPAPSPEDEAEATPTPTGAASPTPTDAASPTPSPKLTELETLKPKQSFKLTTPKVTLTPTPTPPSTPTLKPPVTIPPTTTPTDTPKRTRLPIMKLTPTP